MAGAAINGPVLIYDDDHYYMGGLLAEVLMKAGHRVLFATPGLDRFVLERHDRRAGSSPGAAVVARP